MSILFTWPFAQWGVNIIRSLLPNKGNDKFIIMAVNYFMQWAEVKALAQL